MWGAITAPRCLPVLQMAIVNLCYVLRLSVNPRKHDEASAGTKLPADAMLGVSPM
jgi:hypothetical protein